MNKERFLKRLIMFGITFTLSFIMSFSVLSFGSADTDNTVASMALAFDKYLSSTGQDFVAAEFSSTDPVDPIRKSEFNQVSVYQNLWQLSKGPDNSLIRVYTPAYLARKDEVVAPLTIYPKEDALDDSGAISPTVYTGYDQDFRGDYLDIEIVKLEDESKQITWSDFYRGGKLEGYKTDTHSIMLSEKLARKIYANRNDIDVEDVTQENIESLVGTILRSKLIQENGMAEAKEREQDKDPSLQDQEIINSPYYSTEACRLKKVIGILDNKSAEKYYPLIGDEFVFVNPTSFVSYDMFHPIVYGMFKNNLVGNRTSLLYFMAFSDYAVEHEEYKLYFCDIVNNELIRNGRLQQNYENCISFYKSSKHVVFSSISLLIGLGAAIALIGYLIYLYVRRDGNSNRFKLKLLTMLIATFLMSLLIFYLIKSFPFFGIYMVTMSIDGFVSLLLFDLGVLFFFLFVFRTRNKERKATLSRFNGEAIVPSTKTKVWNIIKEQAFSILMGFSMLVVISAILGKSGVNSVGIPYLVMLGGAIMANLIHKFDTAKRLKKLDGSTVGKEFISAAMSLAGIVTGVLLAAVAGKLGLIWVIGIGFGVSKLAVTIVLSSLAFTSCFWIAWFAVIFMRKSLQTINDHPVNINITFAKKENTQPLLKKKKSNKKGDNYDSVEI